MKEGIVNAVIHRDYYIKQDIEVKMFPNRLEIISPGLFPFNITKYNIGKERAASYRNDFLVKTLREFPKPPNLDMNEGVKAMRREMEEQDLYMPYFITYPDTDEFVVTLVLRNEKLPSEWKEVKKYLEKGAVCR